MSYYGSTPGVGSGFYGGTANNNNTTTAPSPYGAADASQWQAQPSSTQNGQQTQQQPYGQQTQQQPYGQQHQQQQQPYGYGYGNNNMQQQQQPYGQQQQQQQQVPGAQMWNNPAAMAAVSMVAQSMAGGNQLPDGTMMNLGQQIGQQVWNSSTARMIPGLEYAFITLRPYFAVDNQYILKKMRKILFPFRTNWIRQIKDDMGPNAAAQQQQLGPQYDLPINDENAPDLYLPSMSMITYVLMCAFLFGTAGEFDPEFIPDVTTQCIVIQLVEAALVRFGFYIMQVPVAMLDVWSYTGYKYTGLCISMFFGLVVGFFVGGNWGSRGYYIAFVYTASAMSYFTLQLYLHNIPKITSATGPKREFVIIAFAVLPFLTMLWLSKTKLL